MTAMYDDASGHELNVAKSALMSTSCTARASNIIGQEMRQGAVIFDFPAHLLDFCLGN